MYALNIFPMAFVLDFYGQVNIINVIFEPVS